MARSQARDELQLDENLPFQRRLMLVQRIGWGVLVLGLLAALAGAFGGGGPWSDVRVAAGDVQVRYPRFAHYGGPLRLEIEVAGAAAGEPLALTLGGDYGRRLQIEHIVPEPERVMASDRGVTLEFAVAPGDHQLIRIDGQTDGPGRLRGELRVQGRPAVPLHSFVYP